MITSRIAPLRVVLFLSAIALIGARADAQTLTAGVKAGVVFSSLPNAGEVLDQVVRQRSTETSSRVGVAFGGYVTWPIADAWVFQPEMQFVTKGVKLTEANGAGTVAARINYLEFPLLARYRMTVDNQRAYVAIGPTFGVKAGTSAHGDGAGLPSDVDIDPAIRSFDGGLAFAAGVALDRYSVEVRYTQGLNDIATDLYPHTDSLKNRVFTVSVGVQLTK